MGGTGSDSSTGAVVNGSRGMRPSAPPQPTSSPSRTSQNPTSAPHQPAARRAATDSASSLPAGGAGAPQQTPDSASENQALLPPAGSWAVTASLPPQGMVSVRL